MADETLDGWLDKQIEYAENEKGMLRSYRQQGSSSWDKCVARLEALKEVRGQLHLLWGSQKTS